MSGLDTAAGADSSAWLVLGGAGLALYGLSRESWAGWAMAAAGGFLLYRGLRWPARRVASLPPAAVPPADSPVADRFLRDALEDRPGQSAAPLSLTGSQP